MANELSISLWDLWPFGGLPIRGNFYEEVISWLRELIDSQKKTRYLPKTCEHLFQAYHSIICSQRDDSATSTKNDRGTSSKSDSQVTINSWISFWFLGARKYDKPRARKSKKASRSRSTHNPTGVGIKFREWSSRENMLFTKLGIRENLRDQT